MTPWTWLNYSFEFLGMFVFVAWVGVCILFWRVGRAVEKTGLGASSWVVDGRTPSLVPTSAEPGPLLPTTPCADQPARQSTTPRGRHFGRDGKGNLTIVPGD